MAEFYKFMRSGFAFFAAFFLQLSVLSAQMPVGADTLYGNEWIRFDQPYLRLKIASDGIYRLNGSQLLQAGVPAGNLSGNQLRLYRNGQQTPLYVSTDGAFSDQDYLEFWGQRNRDELDRFLFTDAEKEEVNPWYSMVNDTSVYYLCWSESSSPARIALQNNDLSNVPPKTGWCWYENLQYFTNAYFKRFIGEEIRYSYYNGDGYAKGKLAENALDVPLTEWNNNGQAVELGLRMALDLGEHTLEVRTNDSLLFTQSYSGFAISAPVLQFPASLTNGTAKIKIKSTANSDDKHYLSGIRLRYARNTNFPGANFAEFDLDANSLGNYLEISGFSSNNGAVYVFDQTNRQRLQALFENGLVKVFLPPSPQSRHLLVFSNSAAKSPVLGGIMQFRNFSQENADFILISTKKLFSDPLNGGANPVKAYADYRAGAAGGNFKTIVVDVETLYDQFAYGVRFHPLAIKNFNHFIKKYWSNPKHELLIGKGLDHPAFRSSAQQSFLRDSLFFVPDYGVSGADELYVLTGNRIGKPLFTIGRLPVVKPYEIADYLEKVQQHEQSLADPNQTLDAKGWHKRFLHISGGNSPEQASIASYVEAMGQEIQNNAIGAEVTTLYKSSNDPVQLPPFEQIASSINSGVSTWMYFGHTSAQVVDYDIGLPANYQNKGRYPLFFMLGCNIGQCNNPSKGVGEQFLLIKNKGVVAFMGSTYYSYDDGLYQYAKRFYEHMGGAEYGKSLGEIIASTIASYPDNNFESLEAVLHQMQLMGDPAIHLHTAQTPDYWIDPGSVHINPSPVSIDQGKFQVDLDVVNLGKNVAHNLGIQFDFQDSKDSIYHLKTDSLQAPAFRKKVKIALPTTGLSQGFGRLLAELDPAQQIEETPFSAEQNNTLVDALGQKGIELYAFANDIQAIYPPDFGILDTSQVVLQATALSESDKMLRYRMEFDTTRYFNSPFLQQKLFNQKNGNFNWSPQVLKSDSTVYFWRVTKDSLVNGAFVWKTYSFTHLSKSPPGWSQSHRHQYRQDEQFGLKIDSSSGKWQFLSGSAYAYLRIGYRIKEPIIPTIIDAYNWGPKTTFQWGNNFGVDRGMVLAQFDPVTGKIIPTDANHPYSAVTGTSTAFYEFNIKDSLARIALMHFLESELAPNAIVAMVSVYPINDATAYAPKLWAMDSVSYGKNLFQVLENVGAQDVRKLALAPATPYAYGFLFQNGHPEFPARDTFVTNKDSILEIRRLFPVNWPLGSLTSNPIGPAKHWKSFHWAINEADKPGDETHVLVKGLRTNGMDTLLYQLNTPSALDLSPVSAQEYPYLQLIYETVDTAGRTPTPLHYWRVLYDGYPEGVLQSGTSYTWHADTLLEGDTLRAMIPFENVSNLPMDSLLVRLRVEGSKGVFAQQFLRVGTISRFGQRLIPVLLSSRGMNGDYRLVVEANPNEDQAELFHFNNILSRRFYVKTDDRNPILDVSFDGMHILDNDIVAPKPLIVMTLKDDNRFLALKDTNTFTLSLEEPGGIQRAIAWNDPMVHFFPADPAKIDKKNQARLEWNPTFTRDGNYRLMVNGRDASGNTAGKLEYTIRFRVFTKSSISRLLNYPNPFSTSTCFVYTLTGSEMPAQFKIQIMTVSGKVVREITGAEFGPLMVGTHQSTFCWDGHDQFGDQLANGVYLYRVVAKKADGTDFELFDGDKLESYFKHGFGKMVLMR